MRLTRATGVESIHLVFRVDAYNAQYACAKAEKLEVSNKYRAAGVDLGVPVSAYKGRTREERRLSLCECVDAAIELLVAGFKRRRICEGCELLRDDWAVARAECLRGP